MYLNISKAIYSQPAPNILNDEKLKIFFSKTETRQRCPLLLLLFNIILEVLATAIWQENKQKHPNCINRSKTVSNCV